MSRSGAQDPRAEQAAWVHDHSATGQRALMQSNLLFWAVGGAVDAGAAVRGYYCWSVMDNFEWAEGCTRALCLGHVDYATHKRTPKTSFTWFRGLIADQQNRDEKDH